MMRSSSACTSLARRDSAAADADTAAAADVPEAAAGVRGVVLIELFADDAPPPLLPTDFRFSRELKNVCNTPSPPGVLLEVSRVVDVGVALAIVAPERRSVLGTIGVVFVERMGCM